MTSISCKANTSAGAKVSGTVRHSLTTAAIVLFATSSAAALCVRSADAATEFCPAQLVSALPSSPVASAWYYYRLRALGPRVVEGTIVADTDAGWFRWKQQAVQLTRTTYTMIARRYRARFVSAASPVLTVDFPQPVAVRHAWLISAKAHDDRTFNWDARGEVTCDPADFASLDTPGPDVMERTPNANDPTPAPAPPMTTAVPSSAPFPPATCAQPFVVATVTKAEQPDYPISLRNDPPAGVSVIYVAVDSAGRLADAWIFKSSGYPSMDYEALIAARRSQYAPPISYCRPVGGTYLFQADFEPN